MIKSKAITDSARGEKCTLVIAGWCNNNPETTVYAHYPSGSGGSNKLNGDLGTGGYACFMCHQIIDGRQKSDLTKEDREFYMRRSTQRTLSRLVSKGILTVTTHAPRRKS